MGTSPKERFTEKFTWVLRCLGCPFTGLLYSCNVGRNEVKLCTYWLPAEFFKSKGGENQQPQQLKHRPVGIYTMSVDVKQNDYDNIVKYSKQCIARASVLDRVSSLVSTYFILIGVIAAISRTAGLNDCEDWPFIPLLLSWTILAVLNRVFSGALVVKDPSNVFKSLDAQIIMEPGNESYRKHKKTSVFFVFIFSALYPWISVFLAIYTPPVGYYCRSQYLTLICSIWSFNSVLAYISHLIKENDVEGNSYIHIWFCFCGFVIALLLFVLALFTNNMRWWSIFHEQHCKITCS
ncbi:hypothetical protein GLOIN_2v1766067 [Rhizophagus clarus]|nr:hypothetical protein GLOIN_2v1766067 [Rhizophagus clarus]